MTEEEHKSNTNDFGIGGTDPSLDDPDTLTRDEAMKARGYELVDGRWV